jgi:rRNA-processing protein FCF1
MEAVGTDGGRTLLVDSCALIDYYEHASEVLAAYSRTLGKIYVPTHVVDEATQRRTMDLDSLGLIVIECSQAQLAHAAAAVPRLSFTDRVVLKLAEDVQATLVTNDIALRRACSAIPVRTVWTLELLGQCSQAELLTVESAIAIAQQMHAGNPAITRDLVERFKVALAEART